MRACQLVAVLLVVCLSSASALKCRRCVPSSVGGSCTTTVETCRGMDEICVSVVMTSPRYHYFKRCMRQADAFILKANQFLHVSTCSTDRCN